LLPAKELFQVNNFALKESISYFCYFECYSGMQDENGAAATKNERFGQDGRGGGALTNSNQLRDEGWPDKHPYQVRVGWFRHNYADGLLRNFPTPFK
jgi:hypothetical protein